MGPTRLTRARRIDLEGHRWGHDGPIPPPSYPHPSYANPGSIDNHIRTSRDAACRTVPGVAWRRCAFCRTDAFGLVCDPVEAGVGWSESDVLGIKTDARCPGEHGQRRSG